MVKKRKKRKASKSLKPRHGKNVSFESAIFLFGLLNTSSDTAVIERAFKLALRDPGPVRDGLKAWLESQGVDVDALMSGESTTPTSKPEVMELAEPALKKGAEMATLAQIVDIYLFGKARTPENIVYAFYIGIRFAVARERKPTKVESKWIWEIALWIAKTSKIGALHWKELESRGPFDLKDWIADRKADARKKYETFLRQKKRAEATAEKAFQSLMSDLFGYGEDENIP